MAQRSRERIAAGLLVAAAGAVMLAQTPQLNMAPARRMGAAVTPAYEGWYPNPDGSFTLLIGYFNRNREQTLDILIGPDNKIEPGEPDQGQPTHFLVQKAWGVFAVRVPKDFGSKKVTWTITANGETLSIPFALHPNYVITPFKDPAMGNLPPTLRFSEGGPASGPALSGPTLSGPALSGPPVGFAATLTATAGVPLPITFWAADDNHTEEGAKPRQGPPVRVFLSKYRGPGTVTFSTARPDVGAGGKTTTEMTFSEPGEYVVRVQANDSSGDGGGGFQCCWTNAHVKMSVTPVKSVAPVK